MGVRGALVALLATQEEPQFLKSGSCHHPGLKAPGCSCHNPNRDGYTFLGETEFFLPHSVDTTQIPSAATKWMLEPE